MDHENVKVLKISHEAFDPSEVTKMVLFKSRDAVLHISFVLNLPQYPGQDKILIFKIVDSQPELAKELTLSSKVNSICVGAAIQNSGYEISKQFYADNSYYIDVADTNLDSNPLMDFHDDFGLENEEAAKKKEPEFLVVQTMDKKLSKVPVADGQDIAEMLEMPTLCSQIQAAHISGSECIIGFNQQQMRLYINDKIFSNECTSFHVSQTFLSFINSTQGLSHELFNYDLNKQLPKPTGTSAGGTDLPQHPHLDESGNFNIRAVERGSKIVTVDPGTRTVLQMPRGNLEGIHPRIILLKKLIDDIENLNYGKAFKALRQHKIDINLLYDVNPE